MDDPKPHRLHSWQSARGTDHGFVPSAIPGYAGLILGDLIFGMIVGFVQYIVFRRTGFLPASIKWIVANSIGFTLGAQIGALLTFRITENWILAGIIFGVFMGGSVGLTTAITLYKHTVPQRLFTWFIASIVAWSLGEGIAFTSFFSIKTVPLVALAIAAVTGLGLIYLQPHLRAE